MRADIDKQGRLLLQPQSQTEEAALFAWWEKGDGLTIARDRVLALAYQPDQHGTNIEQLLAAAVRAQEVLAKRVPLKMVDGVPVEYSAECSEGVREKIFNACMHCVSDKRLSEALVQDFLALIKRKG